MDDADGARPTRSEGREPPRPPAALLLDMDGVLVDTEERWDRVERRLLDRAGAGSVPRDAVRGIAVDETYAILAERADLSVDRETFAAWYDEAATEEVYPDAPLLPGASGLVADARAGGVPVAVVSSAAPSWIDAVLGRIDAPVDAAVSGGAIDRPGKPDPAPYEVAAGRLDAVPGDCVAVDDSAVGVESARAAGAYVVGYGADDDDRSAAHERVTEPAALVERLRELTGV